MAIDNIQGQLTAARLVLEGGAGITAVTLSQDATRAFGTLLVDQLAAMVKGGKTQDAADLVARVNAHIDGETIKIELPFSNVPNGDTDKDRFFAGVQGGLTRRHDLTPVQLRDLN